MMTVPPIDSRSTQLSSEIAVDIRGLKKNFGTRELLRNLDLTIHRGEFVALLGASGSGKTTLLRILASLDRADDGAVFAATNRTVVFQEPRLLPFMRVHSNVTLGTNAPKGAAVAALAEVQLERHVDAWPSILSGGEAQRVALARALIREPGLLLLDEPFAALDALTRIRMHELVLRLVRKHSPGVLLVTHDVDEAIKIADRVMVLVDGHLSVDIDLVERLGDDRVGPEARRIRTELLTELGALPAPGTNHPDKGYEL